MKRPALSTAQKKMVGSPATSFFRDKHKLLISCTGTVCVIAAAGEPSGRPAPFVPERI